MTINSFYKLCSRIKALIISTFLLIAFEVTAQEDLPVEVEIGRDASELIDLMAGAPNPNPQAASLLDTAMILTNTDFVPAVIHCHANTENGDTIARVRIRVPGRGVRFFLASDIIDESGYVGNVVCMAPGVVIGTEVLLGAVTTDIEVHQDYRGNGSIMLFPVTATK